MKCRTCWARLLKGEANHIMNNYKKNGTFSSSFRRQGSSILKGYSRCACYYCRLHGLAHAVLTSFWACDWPSVLFEHCRERLVCSWTHRCRYKPWSRNTQGVHNKNTLAQPAKTYQFLRGYKQYISAEMLSCRRPLSTWTLTKTCLQPCWKNNTFFDCVTLGILAVFFDINCVLITQCISILTLKCQWEIKGCLCSSSFCFLSQLGSVWGAGLLWGELRRGERPVRMPGGLGGAQTQSCLSNACPGGKSNDSIQSCNLVVLLGTCSTTAAACVFL